MKEILSNHWEQNQGKVWLLGAGPGDAGLLTCKAKEVLRRAEVVVYDALISLEILAIIPNHAEQINAGKRAGNHMMPQEEINRLLLEKALEGKQVVRLKGGDPFVFGRGSEELELLVKYKIAFEIVPGVTSAIAVPAYAGIPVTSRDITSSFHIITGHARHNGMERINYRALVEMKATLVFLMGISSLPKICESLLAAGMAPDMPAAIISKGTTAQQSKVIAVISTLAEKAKQEKIKTPAVIVVGEVCRLAELYDWVSKRPLGGRNVLVTRPEERISTIAKKLRFLGAQVIEMPSIRIKRLKNNNILKEAIERIYQSKQEEWFVFTSPSGVNLFFEQLIEWRMDLRKVFSEQVKIAVIGSGTKKELASHGIFADLMPEEYSAAALGKLLAETLKSQWQDDEHKQPERQQESEKQQKMSKDKKLQKNTSNKDQKLQKNLQAIEKRVHIIRAKEGSEDLIKPLYNAGIGYEDIPLYETILVKNEILSEKIKEMILEGELDFAAFTSASTVRGFIKAVGLTEEEIKNAGKFYAICIGEKTAREAKKYGMKIQVSKEASLDSMIELMCNLSFE